MNQDTFSALGLSRRFTDVLDRAGFCTPTDIQQQAIPAILDGQDVLGLAQTGTGKTAAFGLPLLQLLAEQATPAQSKHPHAVVLAPTRELAAQIHSELSQFAAATSLRLACIFGGVGAQPQINALRKGVDVLIATPGRLLDLLSSEALRLGHVRYIVLDEADRLLDLGFAPDVRRIIARIPHRRHALMFSATMPSAVERLAREFLQQPRRIEVTPQTVAVTKIDQAVARVATADKQKALASLLHRAECTKAIVFTRTKHGADRVVKRLGRVGIEAAAIHGNKSQNARTRALAGFADGGVWVLVATDIAARGIDIDRISHVINFDIPPDPETYVHRIGRTGRAGADGTAWSLLDPTEEKYWRGIQRLLGFAPTEMTLTLPAEDASVRGPSPTTTPASATATPSPASAAHNRSESPANPRRRRRRRGGRRTATSVG